MKFAVIGTGAVGGYYGALLARHGFEVHFLLHGDFEYAKENGLLIESKNGDFSLESINAYGRAPDMPPCDVAIVALKATQNHQLASILPAVVKKKGTVVLLQNGLGVEAEIAAMLPEAAVIGGLCFLCSHKAGPAHIRHLDYGSIRMGQFSRDGGAAGITEELRFVADVFGKAGIQVYLADNLGKARWEKLVWNMSYNGLSVVLNATTDRLMNDPASETLVEQIMAEVIGGAGACGFVLADGFARQMLAATEKMVAYSPSMKLDFEAGRELEIHTIYWRPIQAAADNGYEMQAAAMLARQLEYLDRNNRA
ncbi:MAG: putative 2-dehydropantoate 2-reductase [Desulfobacterales bacterium]|nr:putative 2-dehydropantoate 2-reductase [Desulfobacterales bacterium]